MAKRKRMGKHPQNDMKMDQIATSKIANKGKLDKEYIKTGAKHKYEYLRSHYYDSYATASINFSGGSDIPALNDTITLVSANGHSVTYTAKNDVNCPEFDRNSKDPSGSLASCINSASAGHGSEITATVEASAGTGKILLTHVYPGPDGNTTVVSSAGGMANTTSSSFAGG